MLVALASLKRQGLPIELRCIHVEHGLRTKEESTGDAGFVVSLCEQLGVSCHVASIPRGKVVATAKKRGIGIEAAARLYRRRAWFRLAK
jgi:tRNA(Ile)-lysidine synthase